MPRKSSKTEHVLKVIAHAGENFEPEEETVPITEPQDEPEGGSAGDLSDMVSEPEREFAPEPTPTEPLEPTGSTDMRREIKEQLKEELREELLEELKLETESLPKEEEIEHVQPTMNATEVPPSVEDDEGEPLHIGLHQAAPPVLRGHDLEVINLSEVLAYEMMGEVMRKLNVCDCKICQADVLALTLNRVQQKYITTDAGKQYMQLDLYRKQYETDLLSALTKACVRVKGSPRHK